MVKPDKYILVPVSRNGVRLKVYLPNPMTQLQFQPDCAASTVVQRLNLSGGTIIDVGAIGLGKRRGITRPRGMWQVWVVYAYQITSGVPQGFKGFDYGKPIPGLPDGWTEIFAFIDERFSFF